MGGKRLPHCRHCGRKFRPDVYNQHHQQWCAEPECRGARDRARRRRHYRDRLAREPGFRESERRRCREAMRRSRARRRDPDVLTAAAIVPLPPAADLLTGLVAHLADTTDPQLVAEVMARFAQRGRLLAVRPRNRGPP
jgi:hypothetical protein